MYLFNEEKLDKKVGNGHRGRKTLIVGVRNKSGRRSLITDNIYWFNNLIGQTKKIIIHSYTKLILMDGLEYAVLIRSILYKNKIKKLIKTFLYKNTTSFI